MPVEVWVAIVQTMCCLFAGAMLWQGWRSVAARSRGVTLIVTFGFLARAVAGTLLFWVSYLELPIGRQLQDGDGYWKLASDSRLYMALATEMLSEGWHSVLYPFRGAPSPFYLQTLSVFGAVVGLTIATGILINLFAYLGTCAVILRVGAVNGVVAWPALFALAALSFAPGPIVWSVQPLKDPLFLFLIAAFIGSAAAWQDAWRTGRGARAMMLYSLSLMALLYAIAAVRWYFGVVLLVAAIPFFVVCAATAPRKGRASAASVLLFLVLSQAVAVGAGSYLPQPFAEILRPGHQSSDLATISRRVGAMLGKSRERFEATGGASAIHVGPNIQALERDSPPLQPSRARQVSGEEGAPELPAAPGTTGAGTPTAAPAASSEPAQVQVTEGLAVPELSATESRSGLPRTAQPTLSAGESGTTVAGRPTMPDPASPEPARVLVHEELAGPEPPTTVASEESPSPLVPRAEHPALAVTGRSALAQGRASAESTKGTVRLPGTPKLPPSSPPQSPYRVGDSAPPLRAAPSTPSSRHPMIEEKPVRRSLDGDPASDRKLPASTSARVVSGIAAAVLPRFVNHAFGLVEIGGGQGLWLISELDTLVFDLVLLVALFCVFAALRRGGMRSAALWLDLSTTLMILVLLAYTVSNYGTLFRHRTMVFIGLCMVLALSDRLRSRDIASSDEPVASSISPSFSPDVEAP